MTTAAATKRRRSPTAELSPPISGGRRKKITTTIQDKVVIFIVTIRGLAFERRVSDKSILRTDADKKRLRITKKLLEAKEQKFIAHSIDPEIRGYLKRVTLPSPFKEGVYALPIELIEQVDAQMEEFALRRTEAVQEFKKAFQAAKENAKEKLGTLYKESEYDIDLDQAYRLEWQYVSLGAPESLQSVDNKIYTREQKRIQDQWDAAIYDMRAALRMGLAELVEDIIGRLKGVEDEKRVKPTQMLKRFEEFLTNFQARNVTGDESLEALAEQARDLLKKGVKEYNYKQWQGKGKGMADVESKVFTDQVDVRKQVEKGFKDVKLQLDKLELESTKRRRISFDAE